MKVVLFCGGMGMRIRPLGPGGGSEDSTPKPMVTVGGRHPLLWHVMKYYAHYGHTDFVLCLGYGADTIKKYFLEYNEYMSNDFVMTDGGHGLELKNRDIADWRIHFVDTGLNSNVGTRLWRVRHLLQDEPMFLANYADGLSDLPHPEYQRSFEESGKLAACVCVRPPASGHVARVDADGNVNRVETYEEADLWINGGYFILKREIFDYMKEGEELVREPFQRLIDKRLLYGHTYRGFWQCCDTFKEKQDLDQRFAAGDRPWQVWESADPGAGI
ncbi:MAG: glucose-1-phosphate cytidylyltransferase [Candidatus Hydrogenedens sp.]|nr:glucose-1-phosphate cytidylyltransferase [Candidatus Hydrogenedens sp.]